MSDELKPGDKFRSTCQVAGDDRIVEWLQNGTKPAALAFTSGPERRIADAVETRIAELRAELDRQANEAWMRGDIQTADRLAKLIGAKSPLQHELEYIAECKAKEAAERQPEGTAT